MIIDERVAEKVNAVLDVAVQKTLAAGPITDALRADLELGLVFCIMLDFVRSNPTAHVTNVEVNEQGVAKLRVPIAQMFQGFYDMRLLQMATGQMPSPEDSFEVRQPVPGAAGAADNG